MLGWTQDVGNKWIKMDVTIEPEDVRALFIEAGVNVAYVFALTNNEMYQLQMNEAEKFLLAHQIRSAPDHFDNDETRATLREVAARNKKILEAVSARDLPENDPWT